MFRQILHCVILIVFLSIPLGASADENFSSIFIFGDSLSDNGNLAEFEEAAFLKNLPYDLGFSNGPRAVEVLAEKLGLPADPAKHMTSLIGPVGSNFAVAGARAVTLGTAPTIDLPTQINAFLLSQGGSAPPDALYVVVIGGNDIRDARDTSDDRTAFAIIREAAGGMEDALRTLAGSGAQYVLVSNASDIGAIPETRLIAEATGDPKFIKRATKLTRSFNKQVKKAVRRMERELDLDIIWFDLFQYFRFILRHSETLGFTNTEDACFSTDVLLATGVPVFHPDCNDGLNFDSFIFFDEIHPTAQIHLLVGRAMGEAVEDDHNDNY